MQQTLSDPFYNALRTEHADLAIGSPIALRYPADIIPFAGLAERTLEAMLALAALAAPDETIYLTGEEIPRLPHLSVLKIFPAGSTTFLLRFSLNPRPALK